MGSFEVVGAVGLTLRALLADRLRHPSGNGSVVPVTLGHPGPERDPAGATEVTRVNLFLYRVSENPHLSNQDLPNVGHRGTYGLPPLSLDLHYLLTVFGATASGEFFDETPAHQVLGSAMQVLHDQAIITDTLVTRRAPVGVPVLASALRNERERIKVTLKPIDLEELSNVWTSLELSYRLSVAYEVSVVQIEDARPRSFPQPVRELPGGGPRVFAVPLRRPELASVAVRRPGDAVDVERMAFARLGDTLVLRGANLGGGARVRLDRIETTPEDVDPAGTRIVVVVPNDVTTDGAAIPERDRLQPGAHTVEVVSFVAALPEAVIASGRGVFVLVPGVTNAAVAGRVLTIAGTRLLAGTEPAQTVVGDRVVDRATYLAGSTATQVQVRLPEQLPTANVMALVSGPVLDILLVGALPLPLTIDITLGGEGPHQATMAARPRSLAEAASLLQAAIRAADASPAFAGARVAATGERLVIVPGGLTGAITIGAGAFAEALRLVPAANPATSALQRGVYLSGALRPFHALTQAAPTLDLDMGGETHRLTVAVAPPSLETTASTLEAAIRAASGTTAFANARVTALGDQLCVIPGDASPVVFSPAAGVDETTVVELQLRAAYPVRVRVSGAESIDESAVELPA